MKPLLTIQSLAQHFGALRVLDQVDLDVLSGEIISLIGPNGAGKTTLFNVLTGIYPIGSGQIFFDQHNLAGRSCDWIVQCGIARTFQNIRLFPDMTALENVMVACHCRTSGDLLPALLRLPKYRRQEQQTKDWAMEMLACMGLHSAASILARNLPYGAQRKLEIARALASQPKLLLLDEPAAGMNPSESQAMMDLIQNIRARGVTIMLIEHQMRMVMALSDRVIVLDHGVKIAQGSPQQVAKDPQVIAAYLGSAATL